MIDSEFDNDDFEDFNAAEVLIHIEPDYERIDALGVSMDEFTTALTEALDRYHDLIDQLGDDDEIPDLEDAEILINSQSHRLGDLAEVSVCGDVEFEEDDEDDEDDDDDE
ncbi:MAG TPA: hypothetical protein VFT74_21150, partial [Isosphaeraceae bacterium]|nr:hypothetical protein [Isosphaeraceae bacterium]